MLLKGKIAVITGANRGIGKAIASVFAEEGCNIYACARTQNTEFETFLNELAQMHGISALPLYFDMTNSSDMKTAIKSIQAVKVDILINNAGAVGANRLFQMTSINDMKHLFDVNFFSTMELTQLISRKMVRCKYGSIVNIASVAGIDGDPAQLEYSASKAAVICATKKLALELGTSGIRVNAVAPGVTDTDMLQTMADDVQTVEKEKTILKRSAKPTEIANAVAFLASDKASYITGQTLRVDGGML